MTDAERRLWSALRGRKFDDFKFRRQMPLDNYIVDFVCLEQRLIVEVDDSQHDESIRDAVRDLWLEQQGFRVLRLWNRELLLDLDGALLSILAALREAPSSVRRYAPATFPREGGRAKD